MTTLLFIKLIRPLSWKHCISCTPAYTVYPYISNTTWASINFVHATIDLKTFTLPLNTCLWKPTSGVSDSVGLQPPTASDLNLRQHRTSDSVGLHLRQRRSSISDSVGLLSPTASDFYLRQRRTSSPTASDRTTISDSVGLQSPTAS